MEHLFKLSTSWADLFIIGLGLLALRFILRWAYRLITYSPYWNQGSWLDGRLLRRMQILYEPLAIFILLGVFILIHPALHILLVGAFLLMSYAYARHYFAGRLMQLDSAVGEGKRLRTRGAEGVITRLEQLGLKLRTEHGIQFLNYSDLLREGYLLLSGEEIGGLYHLRLRPKEAAERKDHERFLLDLLAAAPYLDRTYSPQINLAEDGAKPVLEARVLLHDEKYLPDLLRLIQEWGYGSEIIHN